MNVKRSCQALAALLLCLSAADHASAYYAPHLGRWVSRDPIGYLGHDANLYSYIRNRAVIGVDPNGEIPPLVVGIGIGAFWGWWSSPNVANAPAPGDRTIPDPGPGGMEPETV